MQEITEAVTDSEAEVGNRSMKEKPKISEPSPNKLEVKKSGDGRRTSFTRRNSTAKSGEANKLIPEHGSLYSRQDTRDL